MWVTVHYEPVAAFGLRPSNTTSSGGKSLLAPTPYAIKMALLDRMIRNRKLEYGVARFPLVRDLRVWLRVPLAVTVNRTFQKILRPGGDPWTPTIAQREVVFWAGPLTLALETANAEFADELLSILAAINYFGRKGGFIQFAGHIIGKQPPLLFDDYVDLCRPAEEVGFGVLQRMDDMRSDASFDDISVIGKPSRDGGRTSYNVIFPYRLVHHASNHTVYEAVRTTI